MRGAILMARFLQGEPSDAFRWLNPSGFIDSIKERRGQRDQQKAEKQEHSLAIRRTIWTCVWSSLAVAVVAGGGLYLSRSDKKITLSSFFQDLRLHLKV